MTDTPMPDEQLYDFWTRFAELLAEVIATSLQKSSLVAGVNVLKATHGMQPLLIRHQIRTATGLDVMTIRKEAALMRYFEGVSFKMAAFFDHPLPIGGVEARHISTGATISAHQHLSLTSRLQEFGLSGTLVEDIRDILQE